MFQSGNGSRKNKNNRNGGGGRTQAEQLAAKAGALVPGKLPKGR